MLRDVSDYRDDDHADEHLGESEFSERRFQCADEHFSLYRSSEPCRRQQPDGVP